MKDLENEERQDGFVLDYDSLLSEVQKFIADTFDEDEEDYFAKVAYPNTPNMTCVSVIKADSDDDFPCRAEFMLKKDEDGNSLVCAMKQPGDTGYLKKESVPYVESQINREVVYELVKTLWKRSVMTDWM